MDILTTLGINGTFFYQFAIFLIAYVFLTQFLFKPYLEVHGKRTALTNYNEATASQLVHETKELMMKYEFKAREINEHISGVFDTARAEAQHEYDAIVSKAKSSADDTLEAQRQSIEQQIQKVRKELTQELPAISVGIANKLLGKEVR